MTLCRRSTSVGERALASQRESVERMAARRRGMLQLKRDSVIRKSKGGIDGRRREALGAADGAQAKLQARHGPLPKRHLDSNLNRARFWLHIEPEEGRRNRAHFHARDSDLP